MRRIALALALAFALAMPAAPIASEAIQEGVNALGRGDYPRALEIFRPLAEAGDFNAQGFLAHTYRLMEQSDEAYAWYYASAKCGSEDAKIELYLLEPRLTEKTRERGRSLGVIYYDRYCR